MANQKLTDRLLATGVTLDDLIHIVITGDTTDSPEGSSYKATIEQVATAITQTLTEVYVTGGTYSNGTATFTNNTGGTFNVTGFVTGDTYVTGMTFNVSNYDLTIGRNDGVTFTDSLAILASDLTVTGGTYDSNTGIATFTNNTGGTFQVTGFLTGFTDVYVTGGTYSSGTASFTNSTGGTFTVTGFTEPFSGGSGNCISDLYVTNVHGCSPITIYDSIQASGSSATGVTSFAYGLNVSSYGDYSHSEGKSTTASGYGSHAEGRDSIAFGSYSHAEGRGTTSSGNWSHSEGNSTTASGGYSHAEGRSTISIGQWSHAEGQQTTAQNQYSHSEGLQTFTSGNHSHAEGRETTTLGPVAHSEGYLTTAQGNHSHAEGRGTIAVTIGSHTEGRETRTLGDYSHAEGYLTTSSGYISHAEGRETTAGGDYSHTEGIGTVTSGLYQHAQGMWNQTGGTTQGAFIVGNGVDNSNRSNLIFAAGNQVNISGKTITTNFQMTSGATNGYVLTSDSSGNGTWQPATGGGGVSIDPYNNVGITGTSFTWDVSGVSTNYQVILTANTTLDLTNVRNGEYGTIIVTQDGVGSRTLSFGNVNGSAGTHRVANGGGGSPVLTSNASATDILTFTYNGSVMYWTVGNDYT